MLRFAWLALVAGSLLTVAAKAETPPATPQGFGFCSVTDNSSAQAKIWASPVFPLTYASSDPVGFQRGQEIAGEFLDHVRTLGGTGTKSCVVLPTQGEAATFREEQRAIWDKRVYFIKIGDWREVAWAPAAWSPATAATPPAELTRYFYCSHVDTDVPNDLAHTVATTVFARQVPSGNPMAVYDMAAAYTSQFKQQVRAHGLPEKGDCTPFDTRAEAEYQQRQTIKLFKGFNMKFDEIAWTPGEVAIAAVPAAAPASTAAAKAVAPATGLGIHIKTVSAELAQALGLSSAQGAWVVEVDEGSAALKAGIRPMDVLVEIAGQAVATYSDVPAIVGRLRPGFEAPVRVWRERRMLDLKVVVPASPLAQVAVVTPTSPASAATTAAVPASAPDNGQYCTAFITRSKEKLMLRVPVWKIPASQASEAAMSDSVSRMIAAVIQAHPAKWMALPPVTCHDNSGVFPGETFCISNTYKHFGGAQMAAQFCNRSKEMIDKRWADMDRADGGNARLFPWPIAP
ncbi:MAG: S1C family serine protease [Pseudoxanthomonas sp.]